MASSTCKLLSPGVQTTQYWVAWEEGETIEQMQKIVRQIVRFIDADGQEKETTKWFNLIELTAAQSQSKIHIWENGDWKEVTFIRIP